MLTATGREPSDASKSAIPRSVDGSVFGYDTQAKRTTADLSARERSELMDRTIRQVAAITGQVNVLTATCNSLSAQVQFANGSLVSMRGRLDAQSQLLSDALARIESTDRHVARFTTMSFMARLRWLVGL